MRLALRVAAAYAILSAIWILFSDLTVARIFPQAISEIQLVKGWLFVLVSAGLIFILILHHGRQQRRLDLALETHPSGILITDTHLRITYANSSISRISGFQRGELIGQKPSILGSGLTPLPVFEAMHRDIDHGESWEGEFLNRRKSGELYWAATTIIPLRDGRGRVMSYVGTMADISNEKQTQTAMLEAKNMAEEANRTKSDFLANMSHELRTPLNAIVGFTDLLQRGYAGALTESQKDYVNNIAHSSEHLLGLINSVLDLSRVELGHFRIELGEVEVNTLICECLNMLDAIALKKGVIIHFEPCPDALVVSSDRQAIRQIVTNIVGNAVKFSPPGTRIRVKTDRRSKEFEIAVIDQGPGMSTEQIERVFEPFQSRAAHSAHHTEGTGLGLSICRKLIDLLDGRILLSSLEGHGTTVRIILPVLQSAERVH